MGESAARSVKVASDALTLRDRILAELRTDGFLKATDVARSLSSSIDVVQVHLRGLAGEGLVERRGREHARTAAVYRRTHAGEARILRLMVAETVPKC